MVNRKSSRVINMKYQYTIFKNDSTIQELFYNSKNEISNSSTFSITNLKDYLYEEMITRNSNIEKIKSYYRTKKWIMKNYPELMI